jgi:hypothetical protein
VRLCHLQHLAAADDETELIYSTIYVCPHFYFENMTGTWSTWMHTRLSLHSCRDISDILRACAERMW